MVEKLIGPCSEPIIIILLSECIDFIREDCAVDGG